MTLPKKKKFHFWTNFAVPFTLSDPIFISVLPKNAPPAVADLGKFHQLTLAITTPLQLRTVE